MNEFSRICKMNKLLVNADKSEIILCAMYGNSGRINDEQLEVK